MLERTHLKAWRRFSRLYILSIRLHHFFILRLRFCWDSFPSAAVSCILLPKIPLTSLAYSAIYHRGAFALCWAVDTSSKFVTARCSYRHTSVGFSSHFGSPFPLRTRHRLLTYACHPYFDGCSLSFLLPTVTGVHRDRVHHCYWSSAVLHRIDSVLRLRLYLLLPVTFRTRQ